MSRELPQLKAENPYPFTDTQAAIRHYVEQLTDSNPYSMMNYRSYQTVLEWCKRDDYRPTVEEVLKRRLGHSGVSADKAVILCQALPTASLPGLGDALGKLKDPPEGEPPNQIHQIATGLCDEVGKIKADADSKAKDDAWKAWCSVYGEPGGDHTWLPLPAPIDWGYWGLVPVSKEDWWAAQKKAEEEKK